MNFYWAKQQFVSITRFLSKKEIALLAYLAHTGQTHNREALADLLCEARSIKQSLSKNGTRIFTDEHRLKSSKFHGNLGLSVSYSKGV